MEKAHQIDVVLCRLRCAQVVTGALLQLPHTSLSYLGQEDAALLVCHAGSGMEGEVGEGVISRGSRRREGMPDAQKWGGVG